MKLPETLAGRLRRIPPEAVAAVVVFLVFAGTLPYPFLPDWDDAHFITENPRLDWTFENLLFYWREGMQNLWTPLTMNSLMLDHLIWGRSAAFGYRLVNVLLQCGAAVLFIRILKHLGVRSVLAAGFALLWAVHPQRVESVVWITERKDVLSGILALGALYACMNAFDRRRFPLLAVILFAAALSAKPSVGGLPLICGVYYLWKNRGRVPVWKPVLVSAGVFLLAGIPGFLLSFQTKAPPMEALPRFLSVVFHNAFFYIADALVPFRLNPCYPPVDWSDWMILPVFAAAAAGLYAVLRRAGISGRNIFLLFAAFGTAYAAFFSACTGGFRFNPTDYADRYGWLTGLAVWSFCAVAAEWYLRRNPAFERSLTILLGGVLLCFAGMTVHYEGFWKSQKILFGRAVLTESKPNVRAMAVYIRSGLRENDPAPLGECAELFLERSTGENDGWRQGAALLALSGSLLRGEETLLPEILPYLLTVPAPYFPEGDTYLSAVKRQILERISGDEGLLRPFLEWCHRTRPADAMMSPFDWSAEGTRSYFRGEFADAVRFWTLAAEGSGPEDLARLKHNIQEAEKQLK